jgi:hypothetical protein
VHAQLKTALAGFGVDQMHFSSGADPQQRAALPLDRIQRRHVEHDAAMNRHALPVIAGAAAADRDRHAVARRGAGEPDHVGFVARRNQQIGGLTLELALEDRTEPEEIPRLLVEGLWIILDRNVAERGGKRREVAAGTGRPLERADRHCHRSKLREGAQPARP